MPKKDINSELSNIKKAITSLDSKLSSLLPATGIDDLENTSTTEHENITTNSGISLQDYNNLFIDKKFTEIRSEIKEQLFEVRENTTNQLTNIQSEIQKIKPNYFKIFLVFFIPIIIGIISFIYVFYGPYLEKRLDIFKIEILSEIKLFLNANYKKIK